MVLNLTKDMSAEVHTLAQRVNNLQDEIKEIKYIVSNHVNTHHHHSPVLDNSHGSSPNINSTSVKLEKPPTGPFSENKIIDRSVPRPSSKELAKSLGGKVHSLQFTSSLYVNLIERAIGPSSESGLDYKAMVKEAILITKAVISSVKEEHNIDPDLRWSQVDPTIKLNAYRKLEDATEHLLPLKICSEFWGAHVLISNFWLKRKKTKSTSNKTEIIKPEDDSDNNSTNSKKKKSDAYSITFLTNQ